MEPSVPYRDRSAMASYLRGFQRAIGADVLGGPVDLTTEVLNAGVAGANLLGAKLPKIEKPVGGSDWFADRMMSSDDETPQFLAGRLTPLAATLTHAGAGGAKRLVNALVSRSAPSRSGPIPGPLAQEGAIRLGGRPDLMISHDTTLDNLRKAQGRSDTIELYSPSFGITKDRVMTEFSGGNPGNVTLIPRIGAFDPATSPSTLFNRDAYTARYRSFAGKPVGHATKDITEEFGKGYSSFYTAALDLADGKLSLKGFDRLKGGDLRGLSPGYLKQIENAENTLRAAGKERVRDVVLSSSHTFGNRSAEEEAILKAYTLVTDLGPVLQKVSPPDLRQEAAKRLKDRLMQSGKNQAGREAFGGFLGNGPKFDGDVTGDLPRDIAIRSSPAFRSFAEYERSPMGAGLLTEDIRYPYNLRVEQIMRDALRKAEGYREPSGGTSSLDRLDINNLLDYMVHQAASDPSILNNDQEFKVVARNFMRDYKNGYEGRELDRVLLETINRSPQFRDLTGEILRQYARVPSSYGELKVTGPVPVSAENFAGAILRHARPGRDVREETLNAVTQALKNQGVPVYDLTNDSVKSIRQLYDDGLLSSTDPSELQKYWFHAADFLQQRAGPARKQPLFSPDLY